MGIHTQHGTTQPLTEEEQHQRDMAENLGQQLFTLFAYNPEYYRVRISDRNLYARGQTLNIPDETILRIKNALESSFNNLEQRLNKEKSASLSLTVKAERVREIPTFSLSFNNLHTEGLEPAQIKAAITKATTYLYIHREEIEKGIHDAIFPPALPSVSLLGGEPIARTVIPLVPTNEGQAMIGQEQYHLNRMEKHVRTILQTLEDIDHYKSSENGIICPVLLQTTDPREANYAGVIINGLFAGLAQKHAKAGKEEEPVGCSYQQKADGKCMLYVHFPETLRRETAHAYVKAASNQLATEVRRAVFGDAPQHRFMQ